MVTEKGATFFASIGIDIPRLAPTAGKTSRMLCRPCLDWSERRPHLAGALGTALCLRSFEAGWIQRLQGTRAVMVTARGHGTLLKALGVRWRENN